MFLYKILVCFGLEHDTLYNILVWFGICWGKPCTVYNVLAWFGLEYVEVHPESLQCTITALGLILNRKYLKLTFMLCLSLNLPSIQYKDKTDTNTNNSFIKSNSQELKYSMHCLFHSFWAPDIQYFLFPFLKSPKK